MDPTTISSLPTEVIEMICKELCGHCSLGYGNPTCTPKALYAPMCPSKSNVARQGSIWIGWNDERSTIEGELGDSDQSDYIEPESDEKQPAEFDFKLVHRKRELNVVPGALSRL
ncbi:uncharacterized protein DNG_07717 [Cephalotrichum gorgonifer]|uniref:Uncharacterized protein n=1 Tax=Cephalotrichum gorgonifer TaxID=2041049 RepID=A0AAE8N2Y3_9PEZI|nr:uncharacterized protein DNG_07717 [Cephalotrichum gorgonifer]